MNEETKQAIAAHLQTIFDAVPFDSPIKNEVLSITEILEIEISI